MVRLVRSYKHQVRSLQLHFFHWTNYNSKEKIDSNAEWLDTVCALCVCDHHTVMRKQKSNINGKKSVQTISFDFFYFACLLIILEYYFWSHVTHHFANNFFSVFILLDRVDHHHHYHSINRIYIKHFSMCLHFAFKKNKNKKKNNNIYTHSSL